MVLLSSGFSSGPVVYEALGALPSAIFPRDGAQGGEMSVEVDSGPPVLTTWAPREKHPPLLGRWCYARAALGPGCLKARALMPGRCAHVLRCFRVFCVKAVYFPSAGVNLNCISSSGRITAHTKTPQGQGDTP